MRYASRFKRLVPAFGYPISVVLRSVLYLRVLGLLWAEVSAIKI